MKIEIEGVVALDDENALTDLPHFDAIARGHVVRGGFAHPDSKRLAELGRAVAERLTIPIVKRAPLGKVREAQAFAERRAHGNVVLTL